MTATATQPQHMRALDRANFVRLSRSQLKRAVAEGRRSAPDVLREVPLEAETMPVGQLLCSMRFWRATKTRRFLGAFHINENRKIGRLTERQRLELADALEMRLAA